MGPKAYSATDCLLVVVPEHVDTFMRDNYTKEDIRHEFSRSVPAPCVNWWRMKIPQQGLSKHRGTNGRGHLNKLMTVIQTG